MPEIFRRKQDFIIENATVADGSGNALFTGDVAISQGRISAVAAAGRLGQEQAHRRIRADGLVLAPGFIDMHSHSDFSLMQDGRQLSKLFQGITLEVIGQDGRSAAPLNDTNGRHYSRGGALPWLDFQEYFRALSGRIVPNVISCIGAGTLREYVLGQKNAAATLTELKRMQNLAERARKHGARFLSSGLEYLPGAQADILELSALMRASGSELYITHMRNEGPGLFTAIKESLRICKLSRCALHISHLKLQGRINHGRSHELLHYLKSESGPLPFSADVYPYEAYSTGLSSLFALEHRRHTRPGFLELLKNNAPAVQKAVEEKVTELGGWSRIAFGALYASENRHLQSESLMSAAQSLNIKPYELLRRVLLSEKGGGSIVARAMEASDVDDLLAAPFTTVCTDAAGVSRERVPGIHPRAYGSMQRFLQRMVFSCRRLSLPAAIHKMSALPARLLRLKDRGLIRPGYIGDLVLFDPDRMQDLAHYNHGKFARGVQWVFINGRPVIEWQQYTGNRPGIVIKEKS